MPSLNPKDNPTMIPGLSLSLLAQVIFALCFWPGIVLAEDAPRAAENAGYLASSNIPETKKGTVLIKKELSGPVPPGVSGLFLKGDSEESLSSVQREARAYHQQGLEYQSKGELDTAIALYQKAIVLDPLYAVAYNDAGIIYEARSEPERAEEAYLKALSIDPQLLSAYSNLAMFYESNRDLGKAAYYWEKRASLGLAGDPWTQKAQQRLKDIRTVLSDNPQEDRRQQEVMDLTSMVLSNKALLKKDNKAQARSYLDKARELYNKGDDVTALKTAIDAELLDSKNDEIKEFVNKLQTRVLSR